MCGRYAQFTKGEALAGRFDIEMPLKLNPTYNAAPQQLLPIITDAQADRLTLARWGFVPEWADGKKTVKPIINARAETVATKPFFRSAFHDKRCLVVADGFYEWKRTTGGKVPYWIALETREPFAFAGIWSTVHDAEGTEIKTYAIITTEANTVVAAIHNRMPVILKREDEADWLNPQLSLSDAQAMLVPFPAELLTTYPVSPKVNSPANNSSNLIERV